MMSHILLLRIVRSCCSGSQGLLPVSWRVRGLCHHPGLGGTQVWGGRIRCGATRTCLTLCPLPATSAKWEPDEKAQWLLIDFRDVVCSDVGWGGRWVPDPQPTGTAGTPCLGSPPCLPLQDSWDHKEYMARVWMGCLLAHPAVKLILSVLIVIKEVVSTR